MDLGALRTFVAVAEHSSFSRAAEELHLAQPAVSQQIKRLERDVGADLLSRSTRRVHLTPAGERLLPRAVAILADVDRAQDEIRMLQSGLAGSVAIGFVGTATYDLLPRVARSVREQLPGVALELFGERLSPMLIDDLHGRRLDIALLRDPSPDPGLTIRPLRSERLVAVLPADHPLAERDRISLAALSDSTFVTHPSGQRSAMYDTVIQACRSVGFLPAQVVEVRETATLVTFVAAGIGVALVPEPVRSLALEGVVFRPLTDVDQTTDLALATRSGELSATVAHVVDVIEAVTAANPTTRA
jgi:DNA-binding transcriptional LysR family regulator